MSQSVSANHGAQRKSRPLDPAALEQLALAYVARFATSSGKLTAYLKRKLRERGFAGQEEGGEPPDVSALVARFVARGYVDDEAFARGRSQTLLQRGYGARRVGQALAAAGIAAGLRETVAPGDASAREAALAYARRRRFGPFAPEGGRDHAGDPQQRRKLRDRQLGALLRAGHALDCAMTVLDAASVAELEAWVEEARDEPEA